MNPCFWVPIFRGKAKVNDMYQISKPASSHQEVLWLDISMDERFVVDVFDARDQLIDKQEDCLYEEFSVAKVEGPNRS
jgi:hypothetical protein